MKTIMTAAVLALSLAAANTANAAPNGQITDPVLVDLAQSGKTLSPYGIWTGR